MITSAVLHPRHKLAYFKKADWEAEWIKIAEAIFRDTFKRLYMGTDTGVLSENLQGDMESYSFEFCDRWIDSFSDCDPAGKR